uniref:Uncharacterized protein n=1 Tax=Neisseria meningitidis TaxID=487 RepID=Q9ZA63_NEIME|nr:hypothetical protein [Neisseria meningitidis]
MPSEPPYASDGIKPDTHEEIPCPPVSAPTAKPVSGSKKPNSMSPKASSSAKNAKGCLKPKTIWQARKNPYSTICPRLFRMSNSFTVSARAPSARNRFPVTKSPASSTAVQPSPIFRPQPPPPLLPHRRLPYRPPRPPVRMGSTGRLQPCLPLSSSLCSFPTSSSYERARPLCRPLPRSRPLHPPNARQNAGRRHRRPPARRRYLKQARRRHRAFVATGHQARPHPRRAPLPRPPRRRARPHAALLPGLARYRRNLARTGAAVCRHRPQPF